MVQAGEVIASLPSLTGDPHNRFAINSWRLDGINTASRHSYLRRAAGTSLPPPSFHLSRFGHAILRA